MTKRLTAALNRHAFPLHLTLKILLLDAVLELLSEICECLTLIPLSGDHYRISHHIARESWRIVVIFTHALSLTAESIVLRCG